MNKLSLATDTFKSESDPPSSPECVLLVAAKRPFYADRTLAELPALGSIAEMLCAIGLDPLVPARVFLDDRIILAQERSEVFPKPGQLLTVRVLPEGGGRGKDTELLTIAVAAVAAIATWGAGAALSAGWVAAGVGTTATTAGTTAAGAAAAITQTSLPIWATALDTAIAGAVSESVKFLGGLAINALIPPPATPAVRLSSTPQSYTVSGGANRAAAFSVIPKIYGARRIFPQYAASPYTELVGHDQYLRMLFLLGYGPLDISQILIGDTAIEDYEDVEWELRAGFTDDAPSRLYPGSVAETDIDIQLSKSNVGSAPTVYGWSVTQTSGPLADELSVDISFPGGLVAFDRVSTRQMDDRSGDLQNQTLQGALPSSMRSLRCNARANDRSRGRRFIDRALSCASVPHPRRQPSQISTRSKLVRDRRIPLSTAPAISLRRSGAVARPASRSKTRLDSGDVAARPVDIPPGMDASCRNNRKASIHYKVSNESRRLSLLTGTVIRGLDLAEPPATGRQVVGSRLRALRGKRYAYVPMTPPALAQRKTTTRVVFLARAFAVEVIARDLAPRHLGAAHKRGSHQQHGKLRETAHVF